MAWAIAGLKNSLKNKLSGLSIRSKLLLVSAGLMVVPVLGVQYVQDMENYLRFNQERELVGRAQIVAAILQGRSDIFLSRAKESIPPQQATQQALEQQPDAAHEFIKQTHLYVRPLRTAIQLDGYSADWVHHESLSHRQVSDKPQSLSYRGYIGTYKKYLYAMFEVHDDLVKYKSEESALLQSDHLKIVLLDKQSKLKHYLLSTLSPGWLRAQQVDKVEGEWQQVGVEKRIRGEWQQTPRGYNIELRMPLSLIGDRLSFYIADIDTGDTVERVIGTAPSVEQPGSIIIPSIEIENLLNLVLQPASRTWVADRYNRVLAVAGNLKETPQQVSTIQSQSYAPTEENKANVAGAISELIRIIYQWVLPQPSTRFEDELSSVSYLQGATVYSALQGQPASGWRNTSDERVRILTASAPVIVNGNVIGAIAIEETSNAILILQNKAMEILINLSVLTFLISVVTLLSYASYLSFRIRKLRDEAEHAISSDGRITNLIKASQVGDEIGDLSRSFSDLLGRLAQYNRYLETMASKLSHELRTPLAVVRSSLENLQAGSKQELHTKHKPQGDPARDNGELVSRAMQGIARLNDILSRMNEATRLEQTLQSEHKERIVLADLLSSCVSAYSLAYPQAEFKLEIEVDNKLQVEGVGELLVQMLDKLVANALDFHKKNTPIQIALYTQANWVCLAVRNQGPRLSQDIQYSLFESMVSDRQAKSDQPHLGLGLYIVRMIAEFHQGQVEARNFPDHSPGQQQQLEGVEFIVSLPLLNRD